MSKFIIILVVGAAAFSFVKAEDNFPRPPDFGMFNPFNFGNGFPQVFGPMASLNPDYIKNLKPGSGQHVSGTFVSRSSQSETNNGVTKEKSSGRVVTNDDGKVKDVSI